MLHKKIAFIMALITKLLRKTEMFKWIGECQTVGKDIKSWYIQTPILINLNWELKFQVHINAYQLAVGAILAQNPTCKIYQPIMYS
jgi:hypothetical protein